MDSTPPPTQIHDFNPGIDPFPDGVFWTMHIPAHQVHIDLGAGRARFSADDLAIEDYTSLDNALSNGPSVPAVVEFEVHWQNVLRRKHVRDETRQLLGDYAITEAHIEWEGRVPGTGFAFASDESGTSHANFAAIGHERNGVFFK